MDNALIAADEIYSVALQIMNNYQVDAKLVPLVMGTVTQRLDTFAIGAMAHELSATRQTEETDESEVE